MQSRRSMLLVFALAAGLLAHATGSALGAGGTTLKEFEVIGKSGAGGSNAGGSNADKSAEEDALRKAVEAAATEIVGPKVALEKQAILAAKILKTPRRWVPEFRVVDRTEAGSTVILKLKAKVAIDALQKDLLAAGVLTVEKVARAMTRVIVLPAPGKSGNPPWWAAGGAANAPEPLTYVLVEALRGKGFEVTEPRRPEPDPDATATPAPAPQPDMARENLLAVARAYDVDVIVRVPWEVSAQTRPLDGIQYALARAKIGPVEAISVKDGAVAAQVSGEGVAGEPLDNRAKPGFLPVDVANRIQEQAMKAAAADVAAKLTAALGDPVAKGGSASTIKVVVAGLDSWVSLARFETVLTTEVKSVRSASLHSIERGEATFELSLDRGIDALGFADEISKKDFSEFSVKVTEKTPLRVVLHVVR